MLQAGLPGGEKAAVLWQRLAGRAGHPAENTRGGYTNKKASVIRGVPRDQGLVELIEVECCASHKAHHMEEKLSLPPENGHEFLAISVKTNRTA